MFYGISNVGNVTSTLVDPLLELVPGAVAAGVSAAVLSKLANTASEKVRSG